MAKKPKVRAFRVTFQQVNQISIYVNSTDEVKAAAKARRIWRRDYSYPTIVEVKGDAQ